MIKGVQNTIDFLLVLILFELREGIPIKDYLTIVLIKSMGKDKCLIRLEQEESKYIIEHEIEYPIEKDIKLYIIDDSKNLTCMYPDEY